MQRKTIALFLLFLIVFPVASELPLSYQVDHINFPSAFQLGTANDLVEGDYWRQKSEAPRPTVIIIPVSGKQIKISEIAAKDLAFCGEMNVFVLYRRAKDIRKQNWLQIRNEADLINELNHTRDIIIQTYTDVSRIVDWLSERPEVDSSRIILEGLSFGGVQAAAILALEPRFAAGVLVLAGGDIAQILLESEEKGVKKIRENLFKNLGWDKEIAYRKLSQFTKDIDPLTYLTPEVAERLKGKVLMINARHDGVVPPGATKKLWLALGKPKQKHSFFGHYAFALFSTDWANQSIRSFFARQLNLSYTNKC